MRNHRDARPTAAERIGPGATTQPQHLDVVVSVVPALTGVRFAGHRSFDRVVFDLDGELPGYDVRYVPQIISDGPGEVVPVRGRASLAVSVFPASLFSDEGPAELPIADVRGLAALNDIVLTGDFEAVVSFGLGVAARTPFLVTRLATAPRVVVDIAHAEPGTGNQLLRRGDRGAAVATWQWRLKLVLHRDIAVDEDFGPATETATRDFQRSNGLTVDGVVGPRSRAAMAQALGL